MKSLLGIVGIATLLVPALGEAQSRNEAQIVALVSRSPENLESLFKITGDNLDTDVTISSYGVTSIVSKGLLASTTNEDSFLRAFVDKKSGVVTAQEYHIAKYGGRGFDRFEKATYDTGGGVRESRVSETSNDVSCGRYGCTHYQDLVFSVDLSALREIAAQWNPANPLQPSLQYRIFGQSGSNVDSVIPANEITAFVHIIDREQRKYLTPKP
ncbi:MAG: hypothetical protein P0Y64_16835 [Candidatus Sphingomonas colombiensis]|nr:hypothetical protein [Sphingomonas sp.]WEK42986.1 MAG: hypothetical protein P0Y64_16835 [Sphingomonas sp.]